MESTTDQGRWGGEGQERLEERLALCREGRASSLLEDLCSYEPSSWTEEDLFIAVTAVRLGGSRDRLASELSHVDDRSSLAFQVGRIMAMSEAELDAASRQAVRGRGTPSVAHYALHTRLKLAGLGAASRMHLRRLRDAPEWVQRVIKTGCGPGPRRWTDFRVLGQSNDPLIRAYVAGDYEQVTRLGPSTPLGALCRVQSHLRLGDATAAAHAAAYGDHLIGPLGGGDHQLFNSSLRIPKPIQAPGETAKTVDPRVNLRYMVLSATYGDHHSRCYLRRHVAEQDLDDDALRVFRADARDPFRGGATSRLQAWAALAEQRTAHGDHKEASKLHQRIVENAGWEHPQIAMDARQGRVASLHARTLFGKALREGERFLVEARAHLPESDPAMLRLRLALLRSHAAVRGWRRGEVDARLLWSMKAHLTSEERTQVRRFLHHVAPDEFPAQSDDAGEPDAALRSAHAQGDAEAILAHTASDAPTPLARFQALVYRAAAYQMNDRPSETDDCLLAARDALGLAVQSHALEDDVEAYVTDFLEDLGLDNFQEAVLPITQDWEERA